MNQVPLVPITYTGYYTGILWLGNDIIYNAYLRIRRNLIIDAYYF